MTSRRFKAIDVHVVLANASNVQKTGETRCFIITYKVVDSRSFVFQLITFRIIPDILFWACLSVGGSVSHCFENYEWCMIVFFLISYT